jgi:O-antigen/teichoic acid export membrane protein
MGASPEIHLGIAAPMTERVSKSDGLSHADKTLRGIRHIGSAQLFTQLVTWGLTAVTIHLLEPRDYGLIATAGIITSLAQLLLDGGLAEVLISQRELPESVQGAAASAVFLISTVLGVIVILTAPIGSAFFRSPPLRLILEVSAFYLPLAALGILPLALLSKQMRFDQIALAQSISTVVQGISTLGLAYLGEGYWALVVGNFIGTALRVALMWLSLEVRPIPNLKLRALRPLIRNSGHMIGQRLTYFYINNFDIFLLSRIGGPAVLGPYSVSRTLSHSPLSQISSVVNRVAVPAFAAKTDHDAQVIGLVFIASIGSTVLFPLFWLLGVVSQIALPLVFGARWSHLVVPFVAFCTVLPLRGLNTLLYTSVIGTGRMATTFKNMLTFAAIATPLMALGVIKGADGVALSWIASFPLVFYLGLRRIATDFSAPLSIFLRPMARPAACAAASALAAELPLLVQRSSMPQAALLGLQCAFGLLAYWTLLRYFGREQYSQVLAITRRLIRGTG